MNILHWTFLLRLVVQIHCLNMDPSRLEEPPAPLPLKMLDPGPPVFSEEPESQLVQGSETARLYCRAKGNPTPEIRWLKDGQPIELATIKDVVRMPSGGLTFLQVRDHGEGATTGIYQCIASNRYGSIASQNASIELASIDSTFRKQPSDAIAALGQSVTIECQGPRGTPEPQITWTKNSVYLILNNRIKVRPGGDLVISNLQRSDTGSYACEATNLAGSRTSTSAMLRVKELPRITQRPSSVKVEVGSTIDLQCKAAGDPSPRIRWSKKHGRLPKRFNQLKNRNLRMIRVEVEDSGEYICTAINVLGNQTASANVTVQMEPRIVRKSDDMTSQVGDSSTLTCRVEGKPDPTIFWRNPDGVELFIEDSLYNGRIRVASNGDLILNDARFEDQGLYTCQAFNSLHSVSAVIRFTVLKKVSKSPPPIIFLPPSNVTAAPKSNIALDCLSHNATTRWYKDGKPVLTGSGRLQLLSSGSLKINNLQKSDEGQYSCQVSNLHGIDEWKAWVSVKNGYDDMQSNNKPLLLHAPGAPSLINSSSECLTVTWTQPRPGDFPILYYVVAYFRIGSAHSTWRKVFPISDNLHQLCNLQPSSQYVFVVRGVNMKGVGRAGPTSALLSTRNEIVVTTSSTLRNLGSIAVEVTKASALAVQNSMRIEWTTNGSCDNVDGFMVISQPISATSSDLLTGQAPCTARTYELMNLEANTKYEVRVRPLKNQRAGLASRIKFLTLQAGIISALPPTMALKTNSKNNHVTVLWQTPPDLPAAHVIGYVIRCRSADDTVERTINVNSTTTQFTITDLPQKPATYNVTVAYKTRMGEGLTSESATATVDSTGSLFEQPVIIAVMAGGVIALLGVVAITIYCCRKSRRKTTGYQGSVRKTTRYDPVTYGGFEITPVGGARTHPDLLREEQQRSKTVELHQLIQNPGNISKSNVISYTSSNGEVRNQVVDGTHMESTTDYTVQATDFSYVPPQQYNAADISRTQLQHARAITTTSQQPAGVQHQVLHRQRSAGSAYSGSISSDVEMRCPFPFTESSLLPSTNLPPPPPTPPVSLPNSSLSKRSRASSSKRSTGDRSSRSGQRSRRSALSNRIPPSQAAYNLPESSEAEYSSHLGTPLLGRASADEMDPSLIPPTPPVRGDSNSRTVGHPRLQYDPKNYYTAPNMAGVPVHYCVGAENDRLGELQLKQRPFPNYDYRSSANISNLSMLNGYGSESDAKESFHDRRSIISTSSADADSFHMESVSQVGRIENEGRGSRFGRENARKRSLPYSGEEITKRNYPTYHNYPVEVVSGPPVNPDVALIQGRKIAKKSRRVEPIDRANSTSSCASSYHQNTGDSGMSAGVGCSTEHSSSLNSHASGEIANKSASLCTTNRSELPPSIGEMSLPHDGSNLPLYSQENVPVSMVRSINETACQSAPTSAIPQRHQSPSKLPQSSRCSSRLPVSVHRQYHHVADPRYPNANTINSNRIPLSPIQSPDQDISNQEKAGTGMNQLQNVKINLESVPPAPQDLSDVPEVSTSDFCEDYSEESQ